MTTDTRTKAVDAMLELLPHREVVEEFWDEACATEARRWYGASLRSDGPANDDIDIVFDGPPAHESGRFVESEDSKGRGISAGEWVERDDGYWVLRIPRYSLETETGRYKTALRDVGNLLKHSPCCCKTRIKELFLAADIIDKALGGEQADTQGNDLPDTESTTPRRIVSMCSNVDCELVAAMNDGTVWLLGYSKKIGWQWSRLPSVPQPGGSL